MLHVKMINFVLSGTRSFCFEDCVSCMNSLFFILGGICHDFLASNGFIYLFSVVNLITNVVQLSTMLI